MFGELLDEVLGDCRNLMTTETSLDKDANIPRIDQSLIMSLELPPTLMMCTKGTLLRCLLFRCKVAWSSTGKVCAIRHTKVNDNGLVVVKNEDIISFDISVSDLDCFTVEVGDTSQEPLSEYLDFILLAIPLLDSLLESL
jgi:hypothetical protein